MSKLLIPGVLQQVSLYSTGLTATWSVETTGFGIFQIYVNGGSPLINTSSVSNGSFTFTSGDEIRVYMHSGSNTGCVVTISNYGSNSCSTSGCEADYTAASVTIDVSISGI